MKINELDREKVLEVLREFKELHPYRGTNEEKIQKFQFLADKLAPLAGKQKILVVFVSDNQRIVADEIANVDSVIVMRDKFSIITFLYEFLLMFDPDEDITGLDSLHEYLNATVDKAYLLFKEVWPVLASKLIKVGGKYVKAEDVCFPVVNPPESIN